MSKSREIVKDADGSPIGIIDFYEDGSTIVMTDTGRPLGRTDKTGTYNNSGVLISRSNIPGLLIKK